MIFLDRYLFLIMWIGWALYWWVTAQNVKANTWREPVASRLAHMGALLLAGYLLWQPRIAVPGLDERLWPSGRLSFWSGAGLTAAGLLFSVWARMHIGRNWSGTVTLKAGHELITSGPYSLVRHPIYTGMLLAFAGTAIARGDGQGVPCLRDRRSDPVAQTALRRARDAAAVWRGLRSLRAQGPGADSLSFVTGVVRGPSHWTRAPHLF